MSLNIKNPEAHEMAARVAELTGASLDPRGDAIAA